YGDVQRQQQGRTPRGFLQVVCDTIVRATEGVVSVRYDIATNDVRIVFEDGHEGGWQQLSDGYHVFVAMVGDLARRAVMLNDRDGTEATLLAEGLVLIDEVDLHLHPRWQRTVLAGLRRAFPRIQFVVSTHSPQVLGSCLNRQVRGLRKGEIIADFLVEGRDSNSILAEVMMASVRGEAGHRWIQEVMDLIDQGELGRAQEALSTLQQRWGAIDPEVIRASEELKWERSHAESE
ncbi:MAG TPA: AAA family ATPase, partial [Myxococcota bacterium]|nr:AAA family ATPase [Myxococcota bacterium]